MRRASGAALAVASVLLVACGGGSSTPTSRVTTISKPATTSAMKPANPPPSTVTTNPTTTASKPPGKPSVRRLKKKLQPFGAVQAAKLALTARSPLVCGLYNPRLLKQSFGGSHGCRSAVTSGGRARSVEVVKTNLGRSAAQVVVVPHGGPSSKEALTISLARTDGRWQLQSIKSNVPVGP
jgi:hypothetical protein